VHGQEYLGVVKYSAPFAAEQLHSLTTSISRALQSLRRFSMELNKPRSRWPESGIRRKIEKWLSGPFLSDVIRYQLERALEANVGAAGFGQGAEAGRTADYPFVGNTNPTT
jgi:hypothetical protein